jgi:hypothetical protein
MNVVVFFSCSLDESDCANSSSQMCSQWSLSTSGVQRSSPVGVNTDG